MNPSSRKPEGRFRRKTGKQTILFIILALVIIGACYLWYSSSRYDYFIKTPVDPIDNTGISFTIKKGDSAPQIAKNLKGSDLILDEDAFKNYVRSGGLDRKIVAGRFMLNKTQTIPDIAATITDMKKSQFILTVPEGSTITDIDVKLAEMEVITPGDFILATKDFQDYDKYPFLEKDKITGLVYPLEGYLFPDTYFLDPQNFHSEDLIQMMLNNFKKRLGDELNKTHSHSLLENITMASILEKEIRTEKDLPIVAGILWKRLDSGWMLGTDSTLLYLKNDNSIQYADLKDNSPYNTRNRTGLPPGPIGNPGIKSIMAVLYPADSPYFYYLTKPQSGEVVYAITNDEHNLNKQKYLN